MRLDFVQGHMGGNKIVLLDGKQLPPGRELEIADKILTPNYLSGHEAGLLYREGRDAGLTVKIFEPTSKCFITACGGLTQVLGKALIETVLGERFSISIEEPVTKVLLVTEAGLTRISIYIIDGKVSRVVTEMSAFVRECYDRGVEPVILQGIQVMRVGKLLVINGDKVKQRWPEVDFLKWNDAAKNILTELQKEFMRLTGEREYNYCLYDWNSMHGGHVRVVFPHCLSQGFIEPSCGTGSIAVGMALWESGEMKKHLGHLADCVDFRLESGGDIELGGPDITQLFLEIKDGRLCGASFTHNRVDITAVGHVIV